MKNILFQILRMILYPLIYCRDIIMDAPILSEDSEPMGFNDFDRYVALDEAGNPGWGGSGRTESASVSDTGWVCHAR